MLLDLPSDGHAPGQARRAVRDVLLRWHLPALVDAVVLAASELVTNAVRYGRPPLRVVVRRNAADVRLDVHDGEPREPGSAGSRGAPEQAESGRGLEIVKSLAVVGCEQIPGDGKVVYATFPLAQGDQTPTVRALP